MVGPRTLASDSVGPDIPPAGDCVCSRLCVAVNAHVCGWVWGKATEVAAKLARVQEATSKQSQLLRTSSVAALTHFH